MEARSIGGDYDDLVFVGISVVGHHGTTEMLADEQINVEVDGPGELIGLGTASPQTIDSFTEHTCRTFRGRALAIIRTTGGPGAVSVAVTSVALPGANLTFEA